MVLQTAQLFTIIWQDTCMFCIVVILSLTDVFCIKSPLIEWMTHILYSTFLHESIEMTYPKVLQAAQLFKIIWQDTGIVCKSYVSCLKDMFGNKRSPSNGIAYMLDSLLFHEGI